MEIHIKDAIVFFSLGIAQGVILLDWYRDKQALRIVTKRKK